MADYSQPYVMTEWVSSLKTKVCNSDFDKLVFSNVDAPNIETIVKYRFTDAGKAAYCSVFNTTYYQAWGRVFPGAQPSQQVPYIGNMFEMDLHLKTNQSMSLKSIMMDVVDRDDTRNVFSVNGERFENIVINPNQTIHFEITSDINLLPKKIFQLERSLQLNQSCMPGIPKPAACGVIVTGSIHQFEAAMGNIKKVDWGIELDPPMVFQVPLFVILSPFRNIYSELSGIKTGMSEMKSELKQDMTELKTGLQQDMTEFSTLLTYGIIWASMSEAELITECNGRTLSIAAGMPRHALIALLMQNAQRQ
jgi:hypothetical protein